MVSKPRALDTIINTILVAVVLVLNWTSGTNIRFGVINLTIAIMALGKAVLLGRITEALLLFVMGVVGIGVDGGTLSGVAWASGIELVGVSVLGESVAVVRLVGLATEDSAKETSLGTGARGVVVLRAGTKALLLAVVAGKGDLYNSGDDEEDAGDNVSYLGQVGVGVVI